jgi:hypothetical protein
MHQGRGYARRGKTARGGGRALIAATHYAGGYAAAPCRPRVGGHRGLTSHWGHAGQGQPRAGDWAGRAPGAASREREGEEGEKRGEGKLTSGLDERQQPLTGIQPRARRGGREGSCCAGKKE